MSSKRPNRTLGPGHDEFWSWCNRGELRLQRCENCHRICWPVVADCEYCGHSALSWCAISGRGKVASWCTFERDYYQGILPIPWETILVELDEGPLFISNPVDFTWRTVSVGMPVTLVFVDCEDDAGAFRLPVFRRM